MTHPKALAMMVDYSEIARGIDEATARQPASTDFLLWAFQELQAAHKVRLELLALDNHVTWAEQRELRKVHDRVVQIDHEREQLRLAAARVGREARWAALRAKHPPTHAHLTVLERGRQAIMWRAEGVSWNVMACRFGVSPYSVKRAHTLAQRLSTKKPFKARPPSPPPRPANHPDFCDWRSWTLEDQWREFRGSGA